MGKAKGTSCAAFVVMNLTHRLRRGSMPLNLNSLPTLNLNNKPAVTRSSTSAANSFTNDNTTLDLKLQNEELRAEKVVLLGKHQVRLEWGSERVE